MGLMNASGQFQQMLDDQLQGVKYVADGNIDDIAVGTRANLEEGADELVVHYKALRRVLDRLQEVVFCGKEGKFVPFVWELNF